jgi:triacylglycerol lipase
MTGPAQQQPGPKTPPDRGAPLAFWLDLVTHPERNVSGYVNFEFALNPAFHFEPEAAAFSRANAWWLAEASLLAYWPDAAQVEQIYSTRAGLSTEVVSVGNTLCHLAFNERFAIVAFRGTRPDQWPDLLDDARFEQEAWTYGHVHAGFKDAFLRIREALVGALNAHAPNRPLWMTGHSLGAAMAVLAADALPETRGVYTFGLPRVGDQEFASRFNQRFTGRSFRYVDDHDVVTHLPPEAILWPMGSYAHVDELQWIDQNGDVGTAAPALPHFIRDVFGQPAVLYHLLQLYIRGQHPVMLDALGDHAPVLYATHVWNDLFKHP